MIYPRHNQFCRAMICCGWIMKYSGFTGHIYHGYASGASVFTYSTWHRQYNIFGSDWGWTCKNPDCPETGWKAARNGWCYISQKVYTRFGFAFFGFLWLYYNYGKIHVINFTRISLGFVTSDWGILSLPCWREYMAEQTATKLKKTHRNLNRVGNSWGMIYAWLAVHDKRSPLENISRCHTTFSRSKYKGYIKTNSRYIYIYIIIIRIVCKHHLHLPLPPVST